MINNWNSFPSEIKDFVFKVLSGIKGIIKDNFTGFYIHGSLAMGGFNPTRSDIDLLVVTKSRLTLTNKKALTKLFLNYSNHPFPIEISVLNEKQLKRWQHPFPFDFHYSESWRIRYEDELLNGTYLHLNEENMKDPDLAAHITILRNRGICIEGRPINTLFPKIPRTDYIASIMSDYQECLENIYGDPVYCTFNIIRVFWYLKEDVISSKKEAGEWALSTLPKECNQTLQKVVNTYSSNEKYEFTFSELSRIKDYIDENVQALLNRTIIE